MSSTDGQVTSPMRLILLEENEVASQIFKKILYTYKLCCEKLKNPKYNQCDLWLTLYTYIPRVPQCLSLVGIGTPPPSLSCKRVCTPMKQKEEEHTRLRVKGWGSLSSDDWRKSLALCLHCGGTTHISRGKCANAITSHGDGGKVPCHHYVNYIRIFHSPRHS
jgi:hypothetical protein